ncbi:MAG: protein kinase domain-containing protein, partial [Gemmatimonadaceae bacterium]
RDIKPENILLHDGQALVADFGIALAVSTAGGGTRMTETGMSLGTPHYMSPEQAMGDREITARSDVYAVGCVLYEMLLGEPPFTGPTAQAVIARVVTENPRSLVAQRRSIPPHVDATVHKALEKLPADRFATAADFATALATPSFVGTTTHLRAVAPRRTTREWALDARTLATMGIAALLLGAALFAGKSPGDSRNGDTIRAVVSPPDSAAGLFHTVGLNGPVAASPDGKVVAFSVARGDTTMLLVKYQDRFEPWSVPGGGRLPVFSPDGQWIAFHRGAQIWKVRVDGGEPVRVGELTGTPGWTLYGTAWHKNGYLIGASGQGLWRVPSAGGTPEFILRPDSVGGVILNPSPAPDGRLLIRIRRGNGSRLALVSPDGTGLLILPEGIESPAWFVGDMLVFTRAGQLSAGRFDLERREVIAESVPVTGVEGITSSYGPTAAFIDRASAVGQYEVVWVTRGGAASPVGLPLGFYRHPRLSPDITRLATLVSGVGAGIIPIATGGRTPLHPTATEPIWLRDGRRIVTSINPIPNSVGLIMHPTDGGQAVDTLIKPSARETWPTDILGDSVVAVYGHRGGDPSDLAFVHVRTRQIREIPAPGEQRGARFSPDGKWLAYQANESGRSEIVVAPWPALTTTHVVSTDGGDEPSWSPDGRELFFRQGNRMMAVRITPGEEFRRAAPVELFHGPFARDLYGDQSYDLARDGRFLMLRPSRNSRIQVQVIYNWESELRRKLAEANN